MPWIDLLLPATSPAGIFNVFEHSPDVDGPGAEREKDKHSLSYWTDKCMTSPGADGSLTSILTGIGSTKNTNVLKMYKKKNLYQNKVAKM